jgi:glucose/arabinose dehydrogenase
MIRMRLLGAAAVASLMTACGSDPDPAQYGANPDLPQQRRGLLPNMEVASPSEWGNQRPTVPRGYTVTAIATDLKVPRQVLVLPNGDVLVAEGKGGKDAPRTRPKDFVSGYIMEQGASTTEGGDRLTLLRDADGDGRYEARAVFAERLNAPYGLALAGDRLYVANQDALVRFDYRPGQIRASGPPATVAPLPAKINHHWTKSLAISPDGRTLYVGIGSNSNVGERGLEVEENRAMIWAVDAQTGAHRAFATGIRNPTALAIQPGLGQLWAVVNERDELGPNLVPDYLTAVRQGAFYGWPFAYWGPNADPRVRPQDPRKVAATIRPDYSLGSHHAPLGIAFSTPAMGASFAEGVFIGEHGSWNRNTPVGYRVVFVPFRQGRPAGAPVEVATGFLADGKARGRPVGVAVDPRGALLIADDLANTVWRVAPAHVPRPHASASLAPSTD